MKMPTFSTSATGVDLAEALGHAQILMLLSEVVSVAEGRPDAYWAGFRQAVEEIAMRLPAKFVSFSTFAETDGRLQAQVEHRAEMLERLSCEADDRGLPRIAVIYQSAADSLRNLASTHWGEISASKRLQLLREFEGISTVVTEPL